MRLTTASTPAVTSSPRAMLVSARSRSARAHATRMNTIATAAGSLIVVASAHTAIPSSGRRWSASVTPATSSPAISASL